MCDSYLECEQELEEAEFLAFEQGWKGSEALILKLRQKLERAKKIEALKRDRYMLHDLEKIPARTKKGYATYFKNFV